MVNPVNKQPKDLSRMEVPAIPCQVVIWLLYRPTPCGKFCARSGPDTSLFKPFHRPASEPISSTLTPTTQSQPHWLPAYSWQASFLMAGLSDAILLADIHRATLTCFLVQKSLSKITLCKTVMYTFIISVCLSLNAHNIISP